MPSHKGRGIRVLGGGLVQKPVQRRELLPSLGGELAGAVNGNRIGSINRLLARLDGLLAQPQAGQPQHFGT